MNALPLIYCPPGVAPPAFLPPSAPIALRKDVGPAGAPPGGMVYGGIFRASSAWTATAAGWCVLAEGQLPQHLLRMDPSPRVLRWRTIVGAEAQHHWRIPVLLTLDQSAGQPLFVSALDRIWRGGSDWDGGDLADLQRRALAIAEHLPNHAAPDERALFLLSFATDVLSVGHHCDRDLLAALGWLTDRMLVEIALAACDQDCAP